jgi:(2Fe-2S) ferredoxin
MPYYDQHLFLCVNRRDAGKDCCAQRGSEALFVYLKEQMKKLPNQGQRWRVNRAGCLGRCTEGPVFVIYPEGIWYHCHTHQDIDEIITNHFILQQRVPRLQLADQPPGKNITPLPTKN